MERTDYIAALERALVGRIDPDEMRQIIGFYQDYINQEIAKGKTESQALEDLGEPRLLAKSILAAHEEKKEEVFEEGETTQIVASSLWDLIRRKPILILYALGALVIFLLVIGILFAVIGAVLPLIVIGAACGLIYRFIIRHK